MTQASVLSGFLNTLVYRTKAREAIFRLSSKRYDYGPLTKSVASGFQLVPDDPTPRADSAFDAADFVHRTRIATRVRERLRTKFGEDWKRRCGHAAAITLEELLAVGVTTYRLAAGRVDESEWYEKQTKKDRLCRYRGVYTSSGSSEYHVWLVDDTTKHKIDCSELPQERYNHSYLWEPDDTVPELEYIEKPDLTDIAVAKLKSDYKLR